MPRGGSNRKRSHGKSKQKDDEFPSAWSEWEWSNEYNKYFRYREINNTGNEAEDYQYEYRDSQAKSESRDLDTIAEGSVNYTYASSPPDHSVNRLAQQLSHASIEPAANTEHLIRPRDVRPLDKSFQLHNSTEFVPGRVFKVVWVEPNGHTGTEITRDKVRRTIHGESSYSSVRRFVIIRSQSGHSVCVPILTYRGRGLNKGGVKANDHCIIYTEDQPVCMEGEEILNDAIRMKPKDHRNQLDIASRINLAKLYTVEHNVKVSFIGDVVGLDLDRLFATYNRINVAGYSQAPHLETPRGISDTVVFSPYASQAGPSSMTRPYPESSDQGTGGQLHR